MLTDIPALADFSMCVSNINNIRTTLYVVSIVETHTYAAPTLGVHIHSSIHIAHPLRKCSTPTLGEDTQKYSLLLCLTLLIQ